MTLPSPTHVIRKKQVCDTGHESLSQVLYSVHHRQNFSPLILLPASKRHQKEVLVLTKCQMDL